MHDTSKYNLIRQNSIKNKLINNFSILRNHPHLFRGLKYESSVLPGEADQSEESLADQQSEPKYELRFS